MKKLATCEKIIAVVIVLIVGVVFAFNWFSTFAMQKPMKFNSDDWQYTTQYNAKNGMIEVIGTKGNVTEELVKWLYIADKVVILQLSTKDFFPIQDITFTANDTNYDSATKVLKFAKTVPISKENMKKYYNSQSTNIKLYLDYTKK